jgi:thioredoxin-dependent peroxiredoxin
MPTVGETAPDFNLLDQDGKLVNISDFRGKKVVLYFYPKDFTSGCELQACNFRDNYDRIQAKNAVVIGVSPDTVESHKEFRSALNLPFYLLADTDAKVIKSWNLWGSRTTPDGKTWEGVTRSHYVIDENGKIIDAQSPVKANESVPKALETLGA